MNKDRKRKLGLFNNAKYSRPVFRNASDKVVIAVSFIIHFFCKIIK